MRIYRGMSRSLRYSLPLLRTLSSDLTCCQLVSILIYREHINEGQPTRPIARFLVEVSNLTIWLQCRQRLPNRSVATVARYGNHLFVDFNQVNSRFFYCSRLFLTLATYILDLRFTRHAVRKLYLSTRYLINSVEIHRNLPQDVQFEDFLRTLVNLDDVEFVRLGPRPNSLLRFVFEQSQTLEHLNLTMLFRLDFVSEEFWIDFVFVLMQMPMLMTWTVTTERHGHFGDHVEWIVEPEMLECVMQIQHQGFLDAARALNRVLLARNGSLGWKIVSPGRL